MKLFHFDKEKDYRPEFLPAALEIIEKPESPLGRYIIRSILAVIILTIMWSIFGKIDEVATAHGVIIPDGNIKVIQSLEGGVITAIYVQEGQHVQKGQLLIELDNTINAAELSKLQVDLETAQVERTLLQVALDGNTERFDELLADNQRLTIDPEILRRQKELKEIRQQDYEQQQKALAAIVAQSREELEIAGKNLEQIEIKVRILEEEVHITSLLAEGGAAPARDLADKQNELEIMVQQKELQQAQVSYYEAVLKEKQDNMALNSIGFSKTVIEDLVAKDKTIQDLEKEIEKMEKHLSLQTLVAPVDGIVQGVSANTIGGVISGEKPIITIVPDNTPLIVEAMLLNKDIGFVNVGQKVDIKLDTFPFQKYGVIPGEIINISPDAIQDEKEGYVYKMKIKPEENTLRVDNQDMPISPGMTAQAEVKTGKRRIIEFFLPGIEEVKDGFELR